MPVRKWTAAQRAKFKATRKAKRGTLKVAAPKNRDALIYLQHAESAIVNRIRTGRAKHIALTDLYTLLALASLRES